MSHDLCSNHLNASRDCTSLGLKINSSYLFVFSWHFVHWFINKHIEQFTDLFSFCWISSEIMWHPWGCEKNRLKLDTDTQNIKTGKRHDNDGLHTYSPLRLSSYKTHKASTTCRLHSKFCKVKICMLFNWTNADFWRWKYRSWLVWLMACRLFNNKPFTDQEYIEWILTNHTFESFSASVT